MSRTTYLIFAAVLLLFATVAGVSARGGKGKIAGPPPYEVPWYSVDGGGDVSMNGNFMVVGVIGQHDAGTMQSQGSIAGAGSGEFLVLGGFLGGGAPLPCFGDTDNNNIININDLRSVILQWGSSGPSGDVNYDGTVNIIDLRIVILNWGPCP